MAGFNVEERALQSAGESAAPVHDAVLATLSERGIHARCLLDVGCGTGNLRQRVQAICERYIGSDAIRHEGFPADADFVLTNLDSGRVALPDGSCDVVACVETIEHVENPRALMRELVRLTAPGGWLVVTTPNQLSLLSKLTLLSKNEFVHFQERPGLYPAHISALLEVDLVRMCHEKRARRRYRRSAIPATGEVRSRRATGRLFFMQSRACAGGHSATTSSGACRRKLLGHGTRLGAHAVECCAKLRSEEFRDRTARPRVRGLHATFPHAVFCPARDVSAQPLVLLLLGRTGFHTQG